jgi:hypothetical protein
MGFTIKRKSLCTLTWLLLLPGSNLVEADTIGLDTRDQNPMLQAYYLPGLGFSSQPGWQYSHSLFISNTFRSQSINNETLVIDVENYRYDFSIAYQKNDWRLKTEIPLIGNGGGTLDGMIEDWHDFFGLPQRGRKSNPNDRLNIEYIKNGQTIFLQNQADHDIGDIEVSLSRQLSSDAKQSTELSIGIELPTGSVESNSGNEAIDIALWMSHYRVASKLTSWYGLVGYSWLGKGGQLANQLKTGTLVAQFGAEHALTDDISAILQLDMHSALIKDSALTAFGNSLQMQIGLQFENLINNHNLDLFFSEDILPGSAPDITIGVRLSRSY